MKKYTALILEDDSDDAELIKLELDKLEAAFDVTFASNETAFRKAIESSVPDIVIADYNLPGFTALDALEIVRERDPDLPVILCSGFIGEEKAVDAMRAGINDYALKDNLPRLGSSVLRELKHYKLLKKIRVEEQLVDATFNASGLSVAIINREGKFTKVNKQFAELSGYSQDELVGLSYTLLNEKQKIEVAETVLNRLLSEGGVHTNEWKLIRKDGSMRYVQSTISRLKHKEYGDLIISYVQDISERKRLKAIREQTEFVANVGGWEMDLVLDRVYCNGMVLDIFDLPDGLELSTSDLLSRLDPKYQKVFNGALEKAIEGGRPFDQILRTVKTNGEKKWIQVTAVPQQVDGRTARIHGTFRDITEEERKNKEFRKLSMVASKTHNGVIIFDAHGKIEWVNESFAQATGYEAEEFIGSDFGELLSGEDTDHKTIKRIKSNFKQRIQFKEEVLIYTSDGNKKWFGIDITPVQDEGTNELKFIEIQEDITKRKKVELEKEKVLNDLTERVKEQTCLYNISKLKESSIEKLLNKAVGYIPPGWRYPEVTTAAIQYEGDTYQTTEYWDTEWRLSVERRCMNDSLLRITVVYIEEMPEADDGPFQKEELKLLESIADHLILKINQMIADKELLEKEKRLVKMGELSKIGYWMADLENDEIMQSTITKEIHEVDEGYKLDLESAINFYPEGKPRDKIRRVVNEAIESGTSFDLEANFVTAKGKTLWVRAIGEAHFESGKCIRLSGSFQDITDRKRAEISSERNWLLLETISKQAEAPIWVHDCEHRYLFVNQQWKKLFGLEDRDIIGKTVFELFDEPTATNFNENDKKILNTNRSEVFEERIVTPEGERYFLTNRFPMSGIPGVGRGVGGVATDITERKQMEKKLKFHSRLLDEVGEAVISTDPEGIINYWNKAAEQMYGWSESETLAQNILDITPTMSSRAEAKEIFTLLKRGENWSGEFEVKRKDGSKLPVSVTNSPLFDSDGNLIAIIGISSDITERKANEKRIIKSLKEKELLLSEVHHRVKNNLAIISSLFSLQLESIVDEELRQLLKNSMNRIHSIAMVHELLYNAESFNDIPFKKYIQKLVSSIRNSIGYDTKDIHLRTEIEMNNLNINQAIPLGLLLNELITNSLKYGFLETSKGNISVSISRSENIITVLYKDDGRGYPESVQFTDTDSLGHILIQTLLRQLDAEYTVETAGKFRLEFHFEDQKTGSHSNL